MRISSISAINRLYFGILYNKKHSKGLEGHKRSKIKPARLMRVISPLIKCCVSLIPLETYMFESPVIIVLVIDERWQQGGIFTENPGTRVSRNI